MKRNLARCGWMGLVILGLAVSAAAQPAYTEVQIENHRCLVAGPENLPDNAPVVFILHGLGANANNLFSLIEPMNLPPCRYVLPDGPISVGDNAYGWYDFQTQSREDMIRSRDYLFRLIQRFSSLTDKPGHFRPVILMGFSQGGVMSLETGLNYNGKIEAIVSMSGYMWYPSQTLAHPLAPKRLPILVVHGTNDHIVPEDWTQTMVKALKGAGYHPVFQEFPMGHQITPDSLSAVTEFLHKVMAHQSPQ